MTIAARPAWLGAPFVLALLFAALYMLLPLLAVPHWLVVLSKGLVCPLLALQAWRWRAQIGEAAARLLVAALLFSAAGDVFLALDRVRLFVPGLASFLLAHLAYLALFYRNRARPFRLRLWQTCAIAALLGYAALMLAWLTPALGPLLLPVCFYIAAIMAMGVAALALPQIRLGGYFWVGLGAISFIFSDSLIAIDKFLLPLAWAGPAIWLSYVAAQVAILLGWRCNADCG
ncbi:lysoplasmalogenase [Ferrovibrio sp.]|uniref:lysoplasmalogenase n=1 Tax=Ferrovibrio sp. TaxID=1917215 RepID=UPI001B67C7FE|nr:lysoplasmalogenase [Ferrovibrio sp.]MBP7064941.1 lysoplasmalogenase [Ferrovibrio sp.]